MLVDAVKTFVHGTPLAFAPIKNFHGDCSGVGAYKALDRAPLASVSLVRRAYIARQFTKRLEWYNAGRPQ